jgi:hypothetical protein
MAETITMTSAEIREEMRKKYGSDKAADAHVKAMLEAAPEEEDFEKALKAEGFSPGGKIVARGFAAFKEYINRNGRPKVADKKVNISIRLPESTATNLRAHEGYSSILGDYIMDGIRSGKLPIHSRESKIAS